MLVITDLELTPIAILAQENLVVRQRGVVPDRDGFVPLAPQLIAWEETYVGPVIALARSDVLNPAGERIASASRLQTVLVLREPQ